MTIDLWGRFNVNAILQSSLTTSLDFSKMASNTIVKGQYVAIIPDFWFFDDSCYYPNTGGDIAASKRKQPERSWTHYKSSYRGEFGKNPSKKLGDVYQEQ
ncbi:hypothetical protein OUZ56_009777 [Daphnia magna]|uniref:Uncharacterized protein n=1 Tax=Daphnia magna TaxID=35525 RepID=A0ABR0AH40_9CRUS|nr:hypothetical protein OUZ56_009777 [Daphnia magna]